MFISSCFHFYWICSFGITFFCHGAQDLQPYLGALVGERGREEGVGGGGEGVRESDDFSNFCDQASEDKSLKHPRIKVSSRRIKA
jgi:hypothetical protein